MSRASAWVRFPDGTVKGALYNGTVDMMFPWLYDTTEGAWDDYQRPAAEKVRTWDEQPDGEVFDVEIATNYGGGFYWPGRASKNVIVEGIYPYGDETHYGEVVEPEPAYRRDGLPQWVRELSR